MDLPIVEGVKGDLGHDVEKGDNCACQQQQDRGVQHSVHVEGEQNHQCGQQRRYTQLQVLPVDDIQDCVGGVQRMSKLHVQGEQVHNAKLCIELRYYSCSL